MSGLQCMHETQRTHTIVLDIEATQLGIRIWMLTISQWHHDFQSHTSHMQAVEM